MSKKRRVQNIEEYLREVSAIKAGWPNATLAFRGQENAEWPPESSAEVRLKANSAIHGKVPNHLFIEYHENLLKKCKLNNYDKRDGKQMDELELLADLRHHQAATCLLDFSRNALIALWFACEKTEMDGKVFVVDTADESTFLEIAPTDIKNRSIRDILEFRTRETDKVRTQDFWYWSPAHLNERITAQHSLFLFGLPSSGKSKLNAEEILIESSSKEQILRELKELHDIHEESLFPDFVGFAYTQRREVPYDTPNAQKYHRRGVEALQRGQNSEAVAYFTRAIELQLDHAQAYFMRGTAYFFKDEYDPAINDFTKAIELQPDDAQAYSRRGAVYIVKDEYDPAINDLTKAIELQPDHPQAYFRRGAAYFFKDEYDPAINNLTKAIELQPDHPQAYFRRGAAYFFKDEYDPAINDLTKAIELQPDHPPGLFQARLCLLLQKRVRPRDQRPH